MHETSGKKTRKRAFAASNIGNKGIDDDRVMAPILSASLIIGKRNKEQKGEEENSSCTWNLARKLYFFFFVQFELVVLVTRESSVTVYSKEFYLERTRNYVRKLVYLLKLE